MKERTAACDLTAYAPLRFNLTSAQGFQGEAALALSVKGLHTLLTHTYPLLSPTPQSRLQRSSLCSSPTLG